MQFRWALAGICTLFLGGACFSPVYDGCKIRCDPTNAPHACPGNLHCVGVEGNPTQTFCAAPEVPSCNAAQIATSAPEMLCHHGMCLTLPEAIRSQLVLLLWPSSLPPAVDAPVATWLDLSGHHNDAMASLPTALPRVVESGGVKFSPQQGAAFRIFDAPSLAFKADDLVVIVVAGVETIKPVTMFRKSDRNMNMPRQVSLDWVFPDLTTQRAEATFNATTVLSSLVMVPPVVAVYAVWRHAGHLELRVNGSVRGSADLPAETDSVENSEDLFIGMNSEFGPPIDTISAVMVVKGRINVEDLASVEAFTSQVFVRGS